MDELEQGALIVSVVSYGDDLAHLESMLGSLRVAADALPQGRRGLRVLLVDNGPYRRDRMDALPRLLSAWGLAGEVLSGHGNLGYGRGHNLAIAKSDGVYHLVVNPDVEVAPEALLSGLAFMEAHPECGLLSPATRAEDGGILYLCKRNPTVFDLLLRGLGWEWLRRRFRQRLEHYEMRDLINDRDVVWDPPIVSGCFMLFRTEALRALGGFDPRYFLYFEDFDLSIRARAVARIAYVPFVRIVHHGGYAAGKGLSHLWMFGVSALKFFGKHGWRWF